jgi:transcriptional regulator with XRE-family HTH domain
MPKAHAAGGRRNISPEVAFGRMLAEIRKSKALSQEEFGARSGYHRTYISQLERGVKSPSLRTIFNLAETLGVAPSQIIRDVERRRGARSARSEIGSLNPKKS